MPKLRPGDAAPDFTLPEINGSTFRLSDQLGNGPIVLTFYRGDFCPTCNRYLHALQERSDQFAAVGARIVAISADRIDLVKQTIERHALDFPVLSDRKRVAVDAYDVIYNTRQGHAEPAVFVLHPDGTIAFENISSGPLGRPTPEDLLAIVGMINRGSSAKSLAHKG